MKDYYQILKIPRSATESEIKKAFRSLAVKYHPDKNLNGQTVTIFQEINEAYENLGDKRKKEIYDQRYDYYYSISTFSKASEPDPSPYTAPNRNRQRYAAPKNNYATRNFDFSGFVPFFSKINLAGFLLCVLLLFDYLLTIKYPNQEIQSIGGSGERGTYYTRGGQPMDELVTVRTEKFKLKVNTENADEMEVGDKMDVFITPLFKIARWVEFKTKPIAASPHYGVYNNFIFLPVLLLIFSSLGLFLDRGPRFVVDMGATVFFFIILTSIFIGIS